MKTPLAMITVSMLLAGPAIAQDAARGAGDYPARPIRIIVPFPPGQTVDVVGRMIGQRLNEAFGVQCIVDNRAGASGIVGTQIAMKATPDGYTLLIASNGTLAGNTVLYKQKLPYNAERDFAPVINFIASPQILVSNVNFPAKTVTDLVNYAKANPGKLSYATPGYGTSSHLAMEMLRSKANLQIVMVPYQGSPAAVTEIIAGQIPIMFEASVGILPHIRSGRVRAIATGGAKRAAFLPDLPTVAESGYPDFDATPWVGMVAPRGTPAALVKRLHAEAAKTFQTPESRQRVLGMGAEPLGTGPEEFAVLIKAEIARWGKVVEDAGIRID